jgi:biopolymer transport protein TolQ
LQGSLNGGVLDLVLNAGPVGKFVLVVLLVFSIVSWALIVEKWWEFRRVRRESMRFLRAFREARRVSGALGAAKRYRESPLGHLYLAACQEIAGGAPGAEALEHVIEDADEDVTTERLQAMDRSMRRVAAGEIARMERYLPFLATTASSAPFIGLFGTVWGVMTAFHGIGQQGSANLAVVAPGISEALIATAFGLGAAIPAVMGYNYFVNQTKRWATEMDGFSLELLNVFSRPAPAPRPARIGKDGL